jgi:pimeloyl-ACP methyl ester carboxylesterase
MSVQHATAADGFPIAYESFGKRDGEALLLIQGLGADARRWRSRA